MHTARATSKKLNPLFTIPAFTLRLRPPHSHTNKSKTKHEKIVRVTGLGKSEDVMDWNFLKVIIISETEVKNS